MTFRDILLKYRKISFSEKDKGERFERLMQAYLQTDPQYANQFKKVWLWKEFPGKGDLGGNDMGIDLVALTNFNEYWAIQCKCFQETSTIDKPAVDSFLANSSREFRGEDLKTTRFSQRLWISTTNKWGPNALEAISGQQPPVTRININTLDEAPVDWEKLDQGIHGIDGRTEKKKLYPHVLEVRDKVCDYFNENERGRLIMACGTGKTMTSLKIAEKYTEGKGTILFLVPSIALIGQTLREWTSQADESINPICICSDPEITRKKNIQDQDLTSTIDLAWPASTNSNYILKQFQHYKSNSHNGMTVVFSTYQSIEVIAKAQKTLLQNGFPIFDLIVCDEAHRTTGYTEPGMEDSDFVKVHDNNFIKSKKRLYMTATPRLYNVEAKSAAAKQDVPLWSMDDEQHFGKEIHRIGFGEAVEKGLLTDYKVIILTLNDKDVPPAVQKMISNGETEIKTDDLTKLIGTVNALSKQFLGNEAIKVEGNENPMKRAVAFCGSIANSTNIAGSYNLASENYLESLPEDKKKKMVTVQAQHMDGTMAAPQRDQMLNWLKEDTPGNECRIITNVRVLSEGVDVPSLDAVLFISAKNSQVDVVQSVGRVMRKSPGKNYGYIIIPVVVPADVEPEHALDDNERYKVVWTVLNALRAHDDRFNATVNKIELNKKRPSQIIVGGSEVGFDGDGNPIDKKRDGYENTDPNKEIGRQIAIQFEQLQDVVFARMVQKVGDRRYWEQWAKDVAIITERQIERIKFLINEKKDQRAAFDKFLLGLQKNINPSINEEQSIEMLAQHIITQPIFDALFEGYSFVKSNAVSVAMQSMIDALEKGSNLAEQDETLQRFYESVRTRAEGIDNAEGKQRIIIELYDKFFKTAFPKMVEKLGIVYTPVEVVDFIVHSVNDILKKEFDRTISDENIHILDPFTGTGTFMVRLLQSGLIRHKDLERKYKQELHANEIVLLAYYIAAINIENAYHDVASPPAPLQNGEGGEIEQELNFSGASNEHSFGIEDEERHKYITVERNIPPVLLKHARELRKNQTKTEEILWQLLRNRQLGNLKFRRQHPLKPNYILDFYCAAARLGIEVDGGYHNTLEQKEYDLYRSEAIQQYGIEIIRFTNDEVINETEKVLQTILDKASPPLSILERARGEEYLPFEGIVLTDTFQLGESDDAEKLFSEMFPKNSERVQRQQKAPLRVIIGNPPYSIAQNSSNDNAQNQSYPKLDKRILETYSELSTASLNRALYDPYIKAYRWSTDRLDKTGGIICFVSNGGWLDGNSTVGFRKSIEKEFSSIYIFNLRGNQRTSGELSRKEGGKIFGSGSRTPISITLLVKNPNVKTEKATIHYHDIGDYLDREQKLKIVRDFKTFANPKLELNTLQPNEHGDWLSMRNAGFENLIPLDPDKNFNLKTNSFFTTQNPGLLSGREPWVYNFNREELANNMNGMIAFYEQQRKDYLNATSKGKILVNDFIDGNPNKISWTVNLKKDIERNKQYVFDKAYIQSAIYRPFTKQFLFFHRPFIERPGGATLFFPNSHLNNIVICVSGIGASKENCIYITNTLIDYNSLDAGAKCFPLYYYEENNSIQKGMFDADDTNKYIRRDAISDFILERAKQQYGKNVTKEDVFYYVYGFLHSKEYRETFANDLKKMLPRLPLVENVKDFWAFSKAGRQLAELHLNYETVAPFPDVEIESPDYIARMDPFEMYAVGQMRFPKKGQKETIIYNKYFTIKNIPAKAYEYLVNGKSAIEWIMERYAMTTHKESGITNNPNDWSRETQNPSYIFDLLLSIINISVQTVDIVNQLPKLNFESNSQGTKTVHFYPDSEEVRLAAESE